ncbi:MAG: isoprenylcysteine carboxylmethyltransferase family protein [Roseiflexaceae bacterium]|nr:isoprenylcysteine carboxylmethyltransferase family protein [Roseiflexaceae bacterium]
MTTEQQGRGEGWVAGQIAILAAIALAPPELGGLPRLPNWCLPIGLIIGLAGGAIGLAGIRGLGQNLTPFPKPKEDATLIQSGIYSVVRHPIYAGLFLAALGFGLARRSIPSLVLSVLLGIFFDQKARREERWLIAKFPEYQSYTAKVRGRIMPF